MALFSSGNYSTLRVVPPKERKELYAKLPGIIQTMIDENK